MKREELEKEALKVIVACNTLREKYHADGIKVYLQDEDSFTIKLIEDEHVVRTIRIGNRQKFDTSPKKGITLVPEHITAPCYNCEDRQVGCHQTCEQYIDYTKRLKEFNNLKTKKEHEF